MLMNVPLAMADACISATIPWAAITALAMLATV